VLEANPGFRNETFPGSADPAHKAIVAAMRGKKLPAIGRIEIAVMEEANPRMLAFDSGALDSVNLPSELADNVLDHGTSLKRKYADRGVTVQRLTQPALQFAYFNLDDPVVGGADKAHLALRRAIAMGFDNAELARVVYGSQALPATQLIPPGASGHDDALSVQPKFDVAGAKALLDRFGYVDRDGDGFREQPDGKTLVITMGSATSARDREFDEIWQKSMKAIGIRLEFTKQKWPDLLKMARAGQLQMWRVGWITTYAEGDAFMQLLYSKNIGQTNFARFVNAEYDALYVKSRQLPSGAGRDRIYRRMQEIAAAYTPLVLMVFTIENTLVQPWVIGYKKHAYREHPFLYLDVDTTHGAGAPPH
jgi:ABC-type transport system substrate-binding protein